MIDIDTTLSATVSAVEPAAETIGRYSRADLQAMHGKRGRKPPEYFTLFPERIRTAPTPRRSKLAEAPLPLAGGYEADPLAVRLRQASPAARRLVSDLLDVLAAGHAVEDAHPIQAAQTTEIASLADEPVLNHVVLSDPVYADPELEPELAEQV